MSKLWQKNTDINKQVEAFTVGNDRQFDMYLAKHDVLGSLAHVRMLESIGLLNKEEWKQLNKSLLAIYHQIQEGKFHIDDRVEDVHSQVELDLTNELGDVGKKIHSGRSRNDQVLLDTKLYLREEIELLVSEVVDLFDILLIQAEKYKAHLLPGYTHLQLAMPSSFGLWFSAYAESLADDLIPLQAAYRIVNKNPLGSAAGYGSSFPLNRKLTTTLLGFDDLNYNVVYAQMGRGKTERVVAASLANIAASLSKLAMDACLYMNQNFGFISFPDELTTGSSIMPHKKNPDVFEMIRGRCNQIMALPNDITLLTANLPSGYHREMQLLKEYLFPAFQNLKDCLRMTRLMLENIQIKENILAAEQYQYLFSVEEVNKLVLSGIPFRDAYKKVASDIESGNYHPDKKIQHTHEGSIGNLCLPEIQQSMDQILAAFNFKQVHAAIEKIIATN